MVWLTAMGLTVGLAMVCISSVSLSSMVWQLFGPPVWHRSNSGKGKAGINNAPG